MSGLFVSNLTGDMADAREITLGLRWYLGDQFAWEMGFTENQSQGPQNIDILFFSSLSSHFSILS